MSFGRILFLLNKYSPLFLICQPTSTATNLTTFSDVVIQMLVQLASYHSIIYGIGGIMASHSREGGLVTDGETHK